MSRSRSLYTEQITVSAVCIGLAVILSMLKLFEMPYGGSMTLFSMLAICVPALRYNVRVGVMAGVAYGILQFILKPYFLSPLQFAFDYLFAFGIMGIAGWNVFKKMKYGIAIGYLAAITGRFVMASLAGYFFWRTPDSTPIQAIVYTVSYNGGYIFVEGIITMAVLLYANNMKRFQSIFNRA